jgi:preprotein translocase subunit SecD
MSKAKKIFTNVRVIILLFVLLMAYITINGGIVPNFDNSGVIIKGVDKDSPASFAGMQSPKSIIKPLSREVITSINNVNIKNVDDYYQQVNLFSEGQKVTIITNENIYLLDLSNRTDPNMLGLSVGNAPSTNLRTGLDLQGGTRVLLSPEERISPEDMELVVDNLKQRLNVYGLSDIIVKSISDSLIGEGNQYILVEIAGVNEEEVKELISKQGKFEAKVGNETVFKGGNDISYVCRSSQCSGIDQRRVCQPVEGGYSCGFMFSISLSPEAAQRQADVTDKLSIVVDNGNEILNESLVFYLDDEKVNELNIAASLKGHAETDISLSGGETGATREEAITNTLNSMKQMQTVLITGSLPVKLLIEKTDTLSPVLGEEFLKNALHIGLLSILAVAVVIFIRYRRFAISIPVVITMVSEIVIILGFAALVGWNLDLAAIAGIIIAAGTGVDDQIVITDEKLKSKGEKFLSWQQKMKRAFFIIMAAYFTTVVAMVPLAFAGAGLLKMFALTTITGISVGVFITRPAFAKIIEILVEK